MICSDDSCHGFEVAVAWPSGQVFFFLWWRSFTCLSGAGEGAFKFSPVTQDVMWCGVAWRLALRLLRCVAGRLVMERAASSRNASLWLSFRPFGCPLSEIAPQLPQLTLETTRDAGENWETRDRELKSRTGEFYFREGKQIRETIGNWQEDEWLWLPKPLTTTVNKTKQ